MKTLLVGNGINIQFDKTYTTKNIIIRLLDELYADDFPYDIITTEPVLLEWYIGKLFLFAKELLNGKIIKYCTCSVERIALADFIDRYKKQATGLRIADIGFEDYYLIHDLFCNKFNIINPERYVIRESMKMAYYYAIYNHGKIDLLYEKYSELFVDYLNSFDYIFSTNYDSNIENAIEKEIHHIHGCFGKVSQVYDPKSLRNQLSDSPLEGINLDSQYKYLHSTAVSTYCGDYKQYQIKQNKQANVALEKLVNLYLESAEIKEEIDEWKNMDNKLLVNLSESIEIKAKKPELHFEEYYPVDELMSITGSIEILGLSPSNDFHLFNIIDSADLDRCTYYFYDKSEKDRINIMLPEMYKNEKIVYKDVKEFWRKHYA